MHLTAKTIKQALIVTGLTVMGLLLVNAFGADLALAQSSVLDPSTDQPSFIARLTGGQTGLRGLILVLLDFALGFLGLLTVVMVIYGGFLYVSSAGNEENVGKAKKILLYAAIGIVVIIASFAIVNTLLGAASTPA
ncbi:MAG: hypothetical protein WCT53_01325 [Candidatus Gracilibacteria bacterium]|jgi:hypothetical protein